MDFTPEQFAKMLNFSAMPAEEKQMIISKMKAGQYSSQELKKIYLQLVEKSEGMRKLSDKMKEEIGSMASFAVQLNSFLLLHGGHIGTN